MKYIKFFVAGIAMSACACGMMSCHNSDDLYDPNVENDKIAQEYAVQFEKRYGKVDPNQTWDFSYKGGKDETVVFPCPENVTRGVSSAAVETGNWNLDLVNLTNLAGVSTIKEIAYIKSILSSLPELDWEPNIMGTHDMWVWYCKGLGSNHSFSLGIHYIQNEGGSYNQGIEYYTNLPYTGMVWNQIGYYLQNVPLGTRVNAGLFQDNEGISDLYWYATQDNPDPYHDENFREKYELKTYKEINTPNGAKYWCFDCNRDGDYGDMICLVEPTTICKRYMVEDLGSIGDFDFNDIVVDIRDNGVKQYAKVRAMGGTLNFTLKIGNTVWSKEDAGFNVLTMYNTENPNYSYDYFEAEFEVEGWSPDRNNISVTVNKMNSEGTLVIPFPKKGDVPMIIAFDPTMNWMVERESIPATWFE